MSNVDDAMTASTGGRERGTGASTDASVATSMPASGKAAVVLLSGGMDSAVVLAMAREQGCAVHALSVAYGQRHTSELAASERVAKTLGAASHKTVLVDLRSIGGSALTADIDVPLDSTSFDADAVARIDGAPHSDIPVTYVPARNTIMLSLALGHAEVLGAADIFCGVNAVDYSGYPDCRPEFIAAFQALANLATRAGVEGAGIAIHAPLQFMGKGDIVREGLRLGVDFAQTVSCYNADGQGRACSHCDACRLRAEGFVAAGVPDPTRYVG